MMPRQLRQIDDNQSRRSQPRFIPAPGNEAIVRACDRACASGRMIGEALLLAIEGPGHALAKTIIGRECLSTAHTDGAAHQRTLADNCRNRILWKGFRLIKEVSPTAREARPTHGPIIWQAMRGGMIPAKATPSAAGRS